MIKSMEIPEGAIDKFHLRHVNYNEFDEMCKLAGFRLIEKKSCQNFVVLYYDITFAKFSLFF